jgi:hypothetical protein
MPPSRAQSTHNLRSAACYGQPLGVECKACGHRGLMALERIGVSDGDMRPLSSLRLKCSACEGRAVALLLFVTRAEADAWVQERAEASAGTGRVRRYPPPRLAVGGTQEAHKAACKQTRKSGRFWSIAADFLSAISSGPAGPPTLTTAGVLRPKVRCVPLSASCKWASTITYVFSRIALGLGSHRVQVNIATRRGRMGGRAV